MIRTAIVLVCCLIGLGAALRSRFGALLFYIWIAFFRPQDWVWIDIEFLRLSLVSAFLLVVPSLATFRWPNVTHRLSLGSAAFVVFAFLGYQAAIEPDVSWYWTTYLAILVLVSMFLITLVDTPQRFVVITTVISGSFAFYSAKAGLNALLAGGTRYSAGLSGAFSDSNAYALGAVMIIYLLLFVAQNAAHKWVRRTAWVAAPLTAMTVVSTFSRAGFLTMVVSGLVFILLQRRRALLLALATLSIPLALLVVPIPEGYFDRLQTIRTYEEINETSALGRIYFWELAVEMAADHPWGIGPWQYEAHYDAYDYLGTFGHRRSVHNSFLQALSETGWMGGAVFVGLIVSSWRILFRLRSRARDPNLSPEWQHFVFTAANSLITSLLAFSIGGFFIAMAYNDLTWMLFALVASLDRICAHAMALSTNVAPPSVALPSNVPAAAHS